jgi:DNA-binding winged helix-turn-helix (wHTH) protein/tetratricopeptide (TPR) repeat protein
MSAYRFDGYRLDVDRQQLIANDHVTPLSSKIFGVLHCLVRAAGRTVTKDELSSEVWQGVDPSDATIVQHVWFVRRLLDERARNHKYILTVPRRGYRFVPRVTYDVEEGIKGGAVAIGAASQKGEPRVWREYFTGMHFAEKRDYGSLRRALQHFNAALALDRTFAPAWIGIAGTYSNMAFYAFEKWTNVLPTALRAITTAIEFDRTSALSHCVLAQIRLAQWDVFGAQRSVETAGNLDAGCAGVYQLSSFIDMWRGDTELAVANAKRTVTLVPSDIAAHGTFANALAAQGDFQNAIESYSKILELDPSCRIARQGRCEAYAADGQLHLAIGDLERLPRTPPNISRSACVYAFSGDRLSASRLFKELQKKSNIQYIEPHCIAQVHIALGRYDEAARLADNAIANHDLAFPAMLNSPLLHGPMKDRQLRQTLSNIRDALCRPSKKIG